MSFLLNWWEPTPDAHCVICGKATHPTLDKLRACLRALQEKS